MAYIYLLNTINTFNNAMFKWFSTIFSLGSPDPHREATCNELKEIQSVQWTLFCNPSQSFRVCALKSFMCSECTWLKKLGIVSHKGT